MNNNKILPNIAFIKDDEEEIVFSNLLKLLNHKIYSNSINDLDNCIKFFIKYDEYGLKVLDCPFSNSKLNICWKVVKNFNSYQNDDGVSKVNITYSFKMIDYIELNNLIKDDLLKLP